MPEEPTAACERYAEAIGDRVDGAGDRGRQADLDAHLQACPACRALLGDLERIRSSAAALERHAPPAAVWDRIAAAIAAGRPGRETTAGGRDARLTFTRWMAIAAGLVLAVGSIVALLWVGRADGPARTSAGPGAAAPGGTGNGTTADLVEAIEAELRSAEEHYLKAIAGLEQIARSNEDALDPQVAATLRRNMDAIDRAIGESRQALRTEPTSQPARESLFEALRRKVSLLQDTIVLMNEMRKGNEAEAARIVEGLNKS